MKKIIAAAVAGGLLVGAGLVTALISSPGTASAQEDSTDTEEKGFVARGVEFLSEVLSDLVTDKTINQEQADAIVAAVENAAEERKAEMEAQRELIHSLFEDGVLTKSEAAQLGEDHPFNSDAYADAWADGELTLNEVRRHYPFRNGFRSGTRFGALFDDGGIDRQEYDSLPDGHPLKSQDLSQYLADDGLITFDELREAAPGLFESWGHGFRHFRSSGPSTDSDA